jgi:hypothetical protein
MILSPAMRRLLTAFVVANLVGCGAGAPPRPPPRRIDDPALLVEEYYRRVNAEDLNGVLSLLAPEPTLTEPFSTPGASTVHAGYASVARFFDYGFRTRDDQIVTEYVRPHGNVVDVGWSLHGTDGVGVSGTTTFVTFHGQIARVVISERE